MLCSTVQPEPCSQHSTGDKLPEGQNPGELVQTPWAQLCHVTSEETEQRGPARTAGTRVGPRSVRPHTATQPGDAPGTAALRAAELTDGYQKGFHRPLPSYGGIWKALRSGL